ncbi:MAG: hypothetical protein WCO14_00620 [bacterium]
MDKNELLAKANKPSEEAVRLHPFYRGKIKMVPTREGILAPPPSE